MTEQALIGLLMVSLLAGCRAPECKWWMKESISAVEACIAEPECKATASEYYKYRDSKFQCARARNNIR